MASSHGGKGHGANGQQSVPSKDMPPLPEKFGPVFFRNQFRTKIELPTKEKYPDVKDKCAIVTGSNTGLGLEASRQLLSLGLSHLIMGVRSLEKGKAAAAKIRGAASPSAKIDVWQLDMESYESIQTFARKCQDLPRLDIVILNAGIAPINFSTAPGTGHETALQINHFGTALLAILLLPVLKSKGKPTNGNPPRLTFINSVMAHLCKFLNKDKRPLLASFDDTKITPWDPEERYGVSKLVSQLFIVKLAENVSADDVVINMVDPGLTKGTRLARDAKGAFGVAAKAFMGIAGRPVERGAATYIDAVLGHGRESHGCFLMNCNISPLACWYYSDGKVLTDVIWKETIQDLQFAGVEDVLASLRP
ncbi:putative Short-chain dehydrogenase/reductase family protein [Pleurostoma richardsiae]|uniref:Short-chain dehydrogenase/reductase family protein n=1 Tax=Pleurostoma richardsiae TaxID=41990 RepID=A0AA38RAG9_9PEZI|nr:putative Short-chain dehydrogenase/reductase family protein [Pleurostoma richardsiae]